MRVVFNLFVILTLATACQAQEISFSEEALNDVFLTEAEEEITFLEVLKKYEGKTVLIDVWASWCKDCIVGMPVVKALQENYSDVEFVFLSLDKNVASWKKGIEHYDLNGEHYFIRSGWKGGFGSGVKLDWIPRYIIVAPNGEISLYKAIKASDINIKKILEKRS